MNLETTVYLKDHDLDVEIEIEFDVSYTPAQTYGPPEGCYPEDFGVDFTEVRVVGDLPDGVTQADVRRAVDDEIDRLTDKAWEVYNDGFQDYDLEDL